jgi:hypothetical protein
MNTQTSSPYTWLPGFVATQAQPEQIEAWVTRTTVSVLEEVPVLGRDPEFRDALPGAVREHWLAFLAEFAQPELHFRLVPAARRLSEVVAQQMLPLETLVKVYRVAQQDIWAWITGLVNEIPAEKFDQSEILIFFWSRAGMWLDASIDASVEAYQEERARNSQSVVAQQYEVVRAVLAGEMTDANRISAELGGYPMSVFHTAMLLMTDSDDAVPALEPAARRMAGRLGPTGPLLAKPGGRQLWCWAATRHAPDLRVLDEESASLAEQGILVSMGHPRTGIEGFAISHEEALGVQGLVRGPRPGHRAGLVKYADLELLVLLRTSPAVDRFVRRVLGELMKDDDAMGRTRETLMAYFAAGRNVEETAGRLNVHKNTVRYRLGQAEELLGTPVARCDADLVTALRYFELTRAPRGPLPAS